MGYLEIPSDSGHPFVTMGRIREPNREDDVPESTDKQRPDVAGDVAQGLQKTLDRHGFGFHYAAIKRCDERYSEHSPWRFCVSEFPVQVRGQDTRIDFILRHERLPYLLLVECKNANPALSDWCFVKAPYIRSKSQPQEREVLAEKLYRSSSRTCFAGKGSPLRSSRIYDLAFEIKSDRKGDPNSSGRGQIEGAATQVRRGVSGLAEAYGKNLPMLEKGSELFLLSAVFTTATVWTSEVDLRDTDVETGTLEGTDVTVEEKDWVWYQYHQSPGLTNTLSPLNTPDSLNDLLTERYARTIAVVSASGIDSFLGHPEWHSPHL